MPIGKIEPFDLSSKQWPAYVRRVNQFMKLNEIKDNLKVSMLITVVGEATYALMCDLCAPSDPETKTYDQLVKLVSDHLEPQRSEIAERHVFRQRRQRPGETLSEFLQASKHLAATCGFGTRLEEDLRDQFVSGLASDAMRSRIFAEKNINYHKAVELAMALEAAERHAEVSGVGGGASASGAASASGTAGSAGEGLHAVRARRAPAASTSGAGGGRAQAGSGGAAGPRASRAGGGGARTTDGTPCWRCGKAHHPNKCRYINYNCDVCNQRGHLKIMCNKVRSRDSGNSAQQNYMDHSDSEDEFYNMDALDVAAQGNKPFLIRLTVDGVDLMCELDTGSRISAINEQCYKQFFQHKKLYDDHLILRSYAGSRIEPLGFISVQVKFKSTVVDKLNLHVIKSGGKPLLGRDWLRALGITQINMNEIGEEQFISKLCKEYPEVFTDRLGTCKKTLRLQLTDESGVYHRARPVPLALRERVEREIERLQRDGSIYRVEHSDFGTPIVPVIKKNGEIRICGDYKITINPKLKRDFYPLPKIEELFATLSNGEEYTKIDLRHAYEQVLLDADSQRYTAITTHIGTFAYRRTPYGLSCVPEQFQKLMEETLRGIPNTVVFLDDICVTGKDRESHMNNLRAVLERLRNMGLTVKLSKCQFLQKSVKYLGFIINKEGLHSDPAKLEAITSLPRPTNVSQLKSFLGMLNQYAKFIPNVSSLLQPLFALLKKDTAWYWDSQCEQAFESAKSALVSKRVLAHYSGSRPLVLSVDSSAYGVGAVLAHRDDDGTERHISCASRTLNDAERNYSQLDKEALAIYFGVIKHHQYLFGRQFILRTDHKPLAYIFGEKKGIPQTAISRLQRWAARLAAYDFKIEFVRSADNGPADALSRLPLQYERPVPPPHDDCYFNYVQEVTPINFKQVASETKKDPVLSKVYGYIMFGWPASLSSEDEAYAYFQRKNYLCVELGCIVFKYRIVIPISLRNNILKEVHEGHLGMNKMKNIARNYVYWPNIDRDIEETCRACAACRAVLDAPARAPLHPWEFPLHPWRRLHVDFFDCSGSRYLIVEDAHSKWIECIAMTSTTASATVKVLRSIFARFGLPSQLVSDNGPPFTSDEFNNYCKLNLIKHTTSAPYRPQGNGEAENAVKILKKVVKRAIFEGEDVLVARDRFLFQYRNCEHSTTGVAPAVALLGRRLRGRLDALRPDAAATVHDAQDKQVAAAGGHLRQYNVGDPVLVRYYRPNSNKWTEGQVAAVTGPVSYKVDLGGVEWRRHQDQIVPLSRKNRFSLCRTSMDPATEMSVTSRGGTDVSNNMETPVGTDAPESKEVGLDDSDYGDAEGASSPVVDSPDGDKGGNLQYEMSTPPPGASDRAIRTHNRAKNKEKLLL